MDSPASSYVESGAVGYGNSVSATRLFRTPWRRNSHFSGVEHDLADVRVGLHQLVRAGRIREWEARMNQRLQALGGEQRPDMLAQCRRQPSLALHRLSPERRGGDLQPLHHERPQIDL